MSLPLKTGPEFAPVPWLALLASSIRLLYMLLIRENPVLWKWRQGRRNERADMEGPFYVLGAPDRQVAEGKALLASIADLKEFVPFLLSVSIKDPKGDPVPYAAFDFWQADTAGVYSFTKYRLRGTFTADAQGNVELLTVPPGKYGPTDRERAGHFHFILRDAAGGKWGPLTTQLYVCRANEENEMKADLVNFIRKPRMVNMLRAWSAPSANGGKMYMDLPSLDSKNEDMVQKVKWWNARLAEQDPELRVVAGGHNEIKMSTPPGWFGF